MLFEYQRFYLERVRVVHAQKVRKNAQEAVLPTGYCPLAAPHEFCLQKQRRLPLQTTRERTPVFHALRTSCAKTYCRLARVRQIENLLPHELRKAHYQRKHCPEIHKLKAPRTQEKNEAPQARQHRCVREHRGALHWT